ncbi:MAG: GNAT family N-acetyltransferase [candidate division WOR-3 bacterium]|nr:MAG: GNAT family N-acetyltransferase [candidate division WOR-3 bacterium]
MRAPDVPRLPRRLPRLTTRRLVLRGLRKADANNLFDYGSDPEMHRWMRSEPYATNADALRTVEVCGVSREKIQVLIWAIELKATGRVIGLCGFNPVEPAHARANLTFELSRELWHRGLATEAVARVIRYGHRELRLNRIGGYCWQENVASARVMERVGMKYEGLLRQLRFSKGAYRDLRFYSHLPSDYD